MGVAQLSLDGRKQYKGTVTSIRNHTWSGEIYLNEMFCSSCLLSYGGPSTLKLIDIPGNKDKIEKNWKTYYNGYETTLKALPR